MGMSEDLARVIVGIYRELVLPHCKDPNEVAIGRRDDPYTKWGELLCEALEVDGARRKREEAAAAHSQPVDADLPF